MAAAGARLSLGADDLAQDLPGPDESGYLGKVPEICGVTSAKAMLKKMNYKLSPHLFAMTACLNVPKAKKTDQEDANLTGCCIFNGTVFTTRNHFLKHTIVELDLVAAPVTNSNQPLWKKIYDEMSFERK